MLTAIIACALALIVPLVVGAALTIYVSRIYSGLVHAMSTLQERVTRCETSLQASSAAGLKAEVDGLAADLDGVRDYARKQFGRLWQRIGTEDKPAADKPNSRLAPTPVTLGAFSTTGGVK